MLVRSLRRRLLSPSGLAAIFVALVPFVYFFPALLGQLVLCPDDALLFNYPLRVAAAQMVRAGHLPLWNPYIFGGMPLFAAAQGGLLFPLNWFFVALSPEAAMNLAVLLAYSAAGLGAYLYARRNGASILGALVTAFTWQWSGFLVAQIGHTNVVHLACLLPWLLWSIDGYAATRARARGLLVAMLVALQVFAGHPQTLVFSLLLTGSYALTTAIAERDHSKRRAYLGSLALIAGGIALSAIQILPTFELLRESVRSEVTYEFFTSFSLPPTFLLTYFAPYVVGGGDGTLFRAPYIGEAFYGEYIGYVGLLPLFLALLAPFIARDRRTIFWACAGLFALALALGRFWPWDLYLLVYHIPVLNLFRVPARHVFEVDFAIAVLAGRAITQLPKLRLSRRACFLIAGAGLLFFSCTLASVTIWRPAAFHLGRLAPVSFLRAPELFMPVVFCAASLFVLFRLRRGGRHAAPMLLALLLADLSFWGQFSGWRASSPRAGYPLFRDFDVVKALRAQAGAAPGNYRVLTMDQPWGNFASESPSAFDISWQPDTYMLHQIENAAGYDGFGLARYSKLAGDMKVWGAFPDPAQTLFVSRVLDLLNVRYVITPSRAANADALAAKAQVGEFKFAERDLAVRSLEAGKRIEFDTPPVEATRFAFITNLAWSGALPDGTSAAVVTLRTTDNRTLRFDLRVGVDSSEWAYDRAEVKAEIQHSRAPIAFSSPVQSDRGEFEAHSYVSSFAFAGPTKITGGSIEVPALPAAPALSLNFLRASFIDDVTGNAVALRKEWMSTAVRHEMADCGSGWEALAAAGNAALHENREALPRVWLTTESRAMPDDATLEVIRSGKFADGTAWDPRRTALVGGAPLLAAPAGEQRAEITRYEPNRVDVATSSAVGSILVLSDNHYPDWRVRVDGKPAPLLRVDYNLRGVQLNAGSHDVRFVYRPRLLIRGLAVSAIAALLLGLWFVRQPVVRSSALRQASANAHRQDEHF